MSEQVTNSPKQSNGEVAEEEAEVILHELRKEYSNPSEPFVLEDNMEDDPIKQFDVWFKNAVSEIDTSYCETNAVALSTVRDNRPSSRMVLMKGYSHNGFTFFTNAVSKKAQDLKLNPHACMLFYWPHVDRQIRIEGEVEVLDEKAADEYWKKRPLPSRIGSKLSHQSAVIPSRKYLEERRMNLEKLAAKDGEDAITRPESWLGYILKPNYFEFWQGQTNRVHDRLIYQIDEENEESRWTLNRLAP
ncbi:pyridoxamine 5'-phosphate oxidase domain-containing protein [Ditylenchus destructor]|nr:pyridoxamine 5'-phosphate oxidase domain-containing protein [Ditylenchus destructor]